MPDPRDDVGYWKSAIEDMIERVTATAPTEPGLYRMPCGKCYVDFFLASDGAERWLVPGDDRSYTREAVAIARHGDHPWERMYTLAHAAAEIRRRATVDGTDVLVLLEQLAATADDADAAEEEEIAGTVRERSEPIADRTGWFGVEIDEAWGTLEIGEGGR